MIAIDFLSIINLEFCIVQSVAVPPVSRVVDDAGGWHGIRFGPWCHAAQRVSGVSVYPRSQLICRGPFVTELLSRGLQVPFGPWLSFQILTRDGSQTITAVQCSAYG